MDGLTRIDKIFPKILSKVPKRKREALSPIVNGSRPIKAPKADAPVCLGSLGGTIVAGDYDLHGCVQLRETVRTIDHLQDCRLLDGIFKNSEDWGFRFSGEPGKKIYNDYLHTGLRSNPREPGKKMQVQWKVGVLPKRLQNTLETVLIPKLEAAGMLKKATFG